MPTYITVRFLHFSGFWAKRQAFALMGKTLVSPWKASGLLFAKYLGSGAGNGFSIWPDFSTYAWIGVWDKQENAEGFFATDACWLELNAQSDAIQGWDGEAIRAHGSWNGQNPFILSEDTTWEGKVAVITRASIRWSQAWRFWWNVPASSKHMENRAGLLFAKGVGEFPLTEQATCSLWESAAHIDAFAYKSKEHSPMIKKTRQFNWYREEMFVRMKVLRTL